MKFFLSRTLQDRGDYAKPLEFGDPLVVGAGERQWSDYMHDSAFRIGELVMRTYSDLPNAKILEIGSLNVNGCLRDVAVSTTEYTGLDLEEGPSVDHVIVPGAEFPVKDNSFDLVMASSVFEHDPRFWETFLRMCRAAKPGGHIYVNAPSNGTVHRYPMDCWRFYPDAGLALVEHANSQGLEIDLVESFIGNRHSDVWNDFVAIFRKGPSAAPLNTAFVYYRYPSLNARTWQSREVYNESDSTEDMKLLEQLRDRCESLSGSSAEGVGTVQLSEARAALSAEREKQSTLSEEVARLSVALTEAEQSSSRVLADNEHLVGQIVTLESNLRQRQEEIEQAWARADELTSEQDELRGRIEVLQAAQEQLQIRLQESDGSVFKIASERHALEKRLVAVRTELDQARRTIVRMEAVSEFRQKQLDEQVGTNRRVSEEFVTQKATLHRDIGKLIDRLEHRENDAHQASEQIAALNEALASVRADALEYHSKASQAIEQLNILQSENKQQARDLKAAEERVGRKERQLDWMRRLYRFIESGNVGLKGMLPPSMRRRRTKKVLQKKNHFDGDAYLAKYADVAESGMNPLHHYIFHGMAEGRFLDSQSQE
ncbi:MAG TPA: methyltransferase domain-containing protein [Candidatus Obscuribacterales bacterium]|nr:methyltransferase domain-containing protein [Candidatus Obscuribacterales bacterium]